MRILFSILLILFTSSMFSQLNITIEKNFGGTLNDQAKSIKTTIEGGFVVAGYSDSNNGDVGGNHGELDFWVIKLDTDLNIEWEKNLGGSDNDYASSIQQTLDGGFIIAGASFSNDGNVGGNNGLADIWIVKLDATGNLL